MVLDMSSVNPLTIYQIVVAAIHPSLISLAMIPLMALVGHFAINIVAMFRLGMGAHLVINGCLAKGGAGKTLRVSEILESRYLDGAEIYHDLERWLVQFNGMLNRKLDEMVAVHYAPGTGIFTTYTRSQFYFSHIFISALPSSKSPIQKFFFLHEIFHGLMYIATRPIASVAALPAHATLAVWMIYTLPWKIEVIAPTFALIVTILAWHDRLRWNAKTLRVSSEIVADAAALTYLSDIDLKQLSESRALLRLNDNELTSLENATRRSALQEHIQMALAGNREQIIRGSLEGFSLTAPRFIEVLFLCSVVALAIHVGAPTAAHLGVAAVALLIVFMLFAVAALFYILSRGALKAGIDNQFPEGSVPTCPE